MVGASTLASGDEHAFLYSRGTMNDLGTLGGSSTSKATAVYFKGQVAGDSLVNLSPSGSTTHAFLYFNAVMADLGIAFISAHTIASEDMRQSRFGGILVIGQVSIRRIQAGVMHLQDDFVRLGNRIGRIGQPEAGNALVIVHEPGLHTSQ